MQKLVVVSTVALAALLFAGFAKGDISTTTGSLGSWFSQPLTEYGNIIVDEVGTEYIVEQDGSIVFTQGSFQLQGGWGINQEIFPNLPAGSLINSGTVSFSDFRQSIAGYGSSTSSNLSGSLEAYCDALPILPVQPSGPFINQQTFGFSGAPCRADTVAMYIGFGGQASLNFDIQAFQNSPLPSTPGYYVALAQLYQSVDYTVNIDYTPAAALPEPSVFWLVGTILVSIVIGRRFTSRGTE